MGDEAGGPERRRGMVAERSTAGQDSQSAPSSVARACPGPGPIPVSLGILEWELRGTP